MERCKECEAYRKENDEEVENLKIRVAVVESKVIKIEENIEKILNNTNWLVKSIVGGFIAAIITFLVKGGV